MAYEDYYKKYLTAYTPQMNQAIADNRAIYDKQAQVVTDKYTGQIEETGLEYADLERQNAVQKLINEREVAENMANLGLTDSGLNRTQQTAVQLSAANNASKIQRQKQTLVDNLKREMNAYLAEIETGRISSESSIRQGYEKMASEAAEKSYQADLEAETKRKEAYYKWLEAQSKAAAEEEENRLLYTSLGEELNNLGQGTGVMRFRDSNGKVITAQKGQNPYTGTLNTIFGVNSEEAYEKALNSLTSSNSQKSAAKYGVFKSNGYQPRGVVYVDDNGKIVDAGSLSKTTRNDYVNGREQSVWYAKDSDTYWIWNGSINEYMLYDM